MNLVKLATKYNDEFNWAKILPRCKDADGYKVHATALSTILPDSDSVFLGVYLINVKTGQSEYLNLRARWDTSEARLCGFPGEFSLWNDDEENPEATIHITQYMEFVIMSEAKRCVQSQLRRKACTVPKFWQKKILTSLNAALEYLGSKEPAREALIEKLQALLRNEHGGCSDNTCTINEQMMELAPAATAEEFSGSGAASKRFQRLTGELLSLSGGFKAVQKDAERICADVEHMHHESCNAVIWDFDGQYSEGDKIHCDSCGESVTWKPESE